jgi:hypothetical protein
MKVAKKGVADGTLWRLIVPALAPVRGLRRY